MCTHPIEQLVGCADGIRCKACGKLFADFKAPEKGREPAKPKAKKETKADE